MQEVETDITAFILSGGKSSRFGTNKSFLVIDGKPLIQRLTELLDTIFPEVVVSSNEPELYVLLDKKNIDDICPGRGPLSGIQSALNFTTSERNIIISCDMPFINKELLRFLCNCKSEKDIILPKSDGIIQPLCGIYSKKILPEVELLLKKSVLKGSTLKGSIYELINRVETEIVDVANTSFYHPDLFFNINTPNDYLYAKKVLDQI